MNRGISRKYRENKALAPDFIELDERTMFEMMNSTLKLAENINYYNENNAKEGSWESILLKDRLFVLVKIAATNIESYKIINDNLSNNSDILIFVENCDKLIKEVLDWKKLLTEQAYAESLNEISEYAYGESLNEISNLIQSIEETLNNSFERNEKIKFDLKLSNKIKDFINENSLKVKKKRIQIGFQIFEDIYGKVVFFKEKASKKFDQECDKSNNHAPHIGLLLAFYKLFAFTQKDVNSLTKRHLDFYYDTVLQQKQSYSLIQHKALIACTLSKGIKDLVVQKGSSFDFDIGNGQKMNFLSDQEVEINHAFITDVITIFKSDAVPFKSNNSIDAFTYNLLHETNVLDSLEVISKIQAETYKDYPLLFGGETHKQCEIGFIISSPILLLEKGRQILTIELKLDHDLFQEDENNAFNKLMEEQYDLFYQKSSNSSYRQNDILTNEKQNLKEQLQNKFFRQVFDVYITTENGWKIIDYSKTSYVEQDRIISIKIPLESKSEQMISFDPLIHEGGYDTKWPCIKFVLNNHATYHPYIFLKEWEIDYIRIKAEVSEVTNLSLSNANGNLDHTIPFAPFGSTPEKGSFFRLQNPFILQRNLTSLELILSWSGLPMLEGGFEKYYEAYQLGIKNDSFIGHIAQTRNLDKTTSEQKHNDLELFNVENEKLQYLKNIKVNLKDFEFHNEIPTSTDFADIPKDSLYVLLENPIIGFGHNVFPEIYSRVAMKNARFFKKPLPLPRQPYVPVIDQLTVKYTSTAKENMLRKQDDKSTSIKLFHLQPFGHVKVFPGSVKSPCHLIPQINDRTNLMIGIKEVYPNQKLSIGFELISATIPNTALSLPKISWTYLVNNEWHNLSQNVLDDGTDNFIKSGIVTIDVPSSIQTEHTLLPNGKFWIRASYGNEKLNNVEDINSRVKNVFIQAIPVSSNESFSKKTKNIDFKNKLFKINAEGIKKIEKIIGPYNMVIDENTNRNSTFYIRVSERLRHKNRGVTNWDIEHILIEKFQQIEKIRVFGRNKYPNEVVLGSNIQIVVIPKNQLNQDGRLEPSEMDAKTLEEIKVYAKKYMSPYAQIEVCNPIFEKLKIRCRITFDNHQKSSLLKHQLNRELVNFLSPNLQDFESEELFEKSFTKTEIYNFINSRPYVQEISWFSVIQLVDVMNQHRIIDTEDGKDINTRSILQTISAYAILTSVDMHHIEIDTKKSKEVMKGIGDAVIGSDFIIADLEGKYID